MSFYSIKDRDVRDRKIEEYLALKKKIKKRNEDEHAQDLNRYEELEETYKPIVESHERMTRDLVEQIRPISEKLAIKKEKDRPIIGAKRRRMMDNNGPITEEFIQRYLTGDNTMDTTYGLRHVNNNFMIGDKPVQFQDDDIVIDGEVYAGTPGLWSLITDVKPTEYTENDYERYMELLHETNVLRHSYDPANNHPRASKSKKWTKLLSKIWEDFQHRGIADDMSEAAYETANEGDGLKIYLQRDGHCFNLKRKGNGMYVTPRPQLSGTRGHDGLFVRVGSNFYDGEGLLLGPRSPFRNIPIVGWLL